MTNTLDCIEIETGNNPAHAIIWMHGLGADGNDFVPIADELGLDGLAPVRFIFPHAPKRPVTINNGYVMRAWYDITFGDLEGNTRRADAAGVRVSQLQINDLIAQEHARGIAYTNIILAGFSQGGAIALYTGLRYPETLGGIMALSTYLPLAETLPQEAAAANLHTAIFIAHGTQDPVVPYTMGQGTYQALQAAGYPIQWHEYPMPHSVCPAEIADIRQFLTPRLRTKA